PPSREAGRRRAGASALSLRSRQADVKACGCPGRDVPGESGRLMSPSNAVTLEKRARQSLGSSHDAIYRLVDRALADRDIAGGRLVDVGCGAGGLWRVLASRFPTYCGLDAVRYEGFPIDAQFCQIDLDSLDR